MTARCLVISHLAVLLAASALAVSPSAAQDHTTHSGHPSTPAATNDSAFRALQQRGRRTMGVDQYASRHRFEDLRDGGRIELQMIEADSAAVAQIRVHLQEIERDFREGRFTTPEATHAMTVPGTAVMARKQDRISYSYRELPKGGEVRIRTRDRDALRAVREFLAFQRSDHRAGH